MGQADPGEMALSTWRVPIRWLEKPLAIPSQVDGMAIKDPNDLAAKLTDGVERKIFADLVKRRKLV